MAEIHIKDIQSLNELNSDILELKRLQQKAAELENRIVKYSTYDLIQIGNIIAKLMTSFEGKNYCCSKDHLYWDNDYNIEPTSYNIDDMHIYAFYKIKKLKIKQVVLDTSKKRDKCYLPPSNFSSNNSSKVDSQHEDTKYVQVFLDYLYQERVSKSLEEITEKELEEILQEFLEISIELQQQRKNEIEEKRNEQIKKQRRREFEKSCVIDRKLILCSLAFIINHYEENLSAKLEKKEEWSGNSQWSVLTGYQILTINYNDRKIYFKAKIDSEGCYPDEEYCGVYVDMNKHTNICFFELKDKLLPILKNSNYVSGFINSIEEMYLEKQNITPEDIHQLLVNISNDKKSKQKALKINNKR